MQKLTTGGNYRPLDLSVRIGAVKFSKSYLAGPKKQTIRLRHDSSKIRVSVQLPETGS